jgi:hypothetical protein
MSMEPLHLPPSVRFADTSPALTRGEDNGTIIFPPSEACGGSPERMRGDGGRQL